MCMGALKHLSAGGFKGLSREVVDVCRNAEAMCRGFEGVNRWT